LRSSNFLPDHTGRFGSRKSWNEIDLEISGEVGINLIDFLLYGEVESEGTVSMPIDGQEGGR